MGLLRPFAGIAPTPEEVARELPGDDLVPDAALVMDRAFTLPGSPADVWPWFVQLGKRRAGWYLTSAVERAIPRSRRALRRLDPALAGLRVGEVIPDWGGRDAYFEVAALEAPAVLVHRSTRGPTRLSWAIVLREAGTAEEPRTRVALRLRLGPVRHLRLARTAGGLIDALTIAGLAAGLRERLAAGDDVADAGGSSTPDRGREAGPARPAAPLPRASVAELGAAAHDVLLELRADRRRPSAAARSSRASSARSPPARAVVSRAPLRVQRSKFSVEESSGR